ncbi:41395_t:CDS:2, partial [Gigaspora margarita]
EKNGKSEVWQNFLEIVDLNNQYIGYVSCKNCNNIFTYSQKSGTSHLLRHQCISSSNQLKITLFLPKKTILPTAKESTTNKIVNFVCKDLRPFEIIEGEGFRDFSQEMINIGAKFGQIQIDDLFPHPTTISRNIIKNMWTDNYKKLSYISLTVHFIKNWQLKEQILAISKFPNISHTADNIRNTILNILKNYNLVPNRTMKNFVFITDSGANFIVAFRNYKHIPCIAHRIFFKYENFQNYPSIIETIKECKSLVTYFKQSLLYLKLEKSLKQESETRWNSKLEMLESIYNQFDLINSILADKNKLYRIENIDLEVLLVLINFLKKFKEASNYLESSKNPTLHLVIPWYKVFKEHCKIDQQDNIILKQIKKIVDEKITLKYKIEKLYKLAIFFNPKMKQLKILEPDDALWVKNQIREQYSLIQTDFESDNDDLYIDTQKKSTKKLCKKSSKEFTNFSEYYDSSDNENNLDEIDQYLS